MGKLYIFVGLWPGNLMTHLLASFCNVVHSESNFNDAFFVFERAIS